MSKNLIHFLAEIATDPNKLAEFQKSPAEAMRQAGLSEDEIKAVQGGDVAALEGLLGCGQPGSPQPQGGAIFPVWVPPYGMAPGAQVPCALLLPAFGMVCLPVVLIPVVACMGWPVQVPISQVPAYPPPVICFAAAPGSQAQSPPKPGEPPAV